MSTMIFDPKNPNYREDFHNFTDILLRNEYTFSVTLEGEYIVVEFDMIEEEYADKYLRWLDADETEMIESMRREKLIEQKGNE